jgi:hypothetical protein
MSQKPDDRKGTGSPSSAPPQGKLKSLAPSTDAIDSDWSDGGDGSVPKFPPDPKVPGGLAGAARPITPLPPRPPSSQPPPLPERRKAPVPSSGKVGAAGLEPKPVSAVERASSTPPSEPVEKSAPAPEKQPIAKPEPVAEKAPVERAPLPEKPPAPTAEPAPEKPPARREGPVEKAAPGARRSLVWVAALAVLVLLTVFLARRSPTPSPQVTEPPLPSAVPSARPIELPKAPAPSETAPAEPSAVPVPAVAPDAGDAVRVELKIRPEGARVYYRGKEVGRCPFTLELPRGETRAFEVGYPGYVTRRLVVDGTEPVISFGMAPKAAAP